MCYDKVTESLRRNENETKTKTIFPAVIGRQLNCFFPRPFTAGYIVLVSFSFRFRFVSSSLTFRHFVIVADNARRASAAGHGGY